MKTLDWTAFIETCRNGPVVVSVCKEGAFKRLQNA